MNIQCMNFFKESGLRTHSLLVTEHRTVMMEPPSVPKINSNAHYIYTVKSLRLFSQFKVTLSKFISFVWINSC